MKIIDVPQGSREWLAARAGLPTASEFGSILTPANLKPSASAPAYLSRLLTEWLLGHPIDTGSNQWMQRGTDLEPAAVAAYELAAEVDTIPVGLCLTDDERAGASPDRLVGEVGLLEIKCPAAHTHMGYVIDPGLLARDYRLQHQGQLWVTGREWVDLFAYSPVFPAVRYRVTRDADAIEAIDREVTKFADALAARRREFADLRESIRAEQAERAAQDPDPISGDGEYIDPARMFVG